MVLKSFQLKIGARDSPHSQLIDRKWFRSMVSIRGLRRRWKYTDNLLSMGLLVPSLWVYFMTPGTENMHGCTFFHQSYCNINVLKGYSCEEQTKANIILDNFISCETHENCYKKMQEVHLSVQSWCFHSGRLWTMRKLQFLYLQGRASRLLPTTFHFELSVQRPVLHIPVIL